MISYLPKYDMYYYFMKKTEMEFENNTIFTFMKKKTLVTITRSVGLKISHEPLLLSKHALQRDQLVLQLLYADLVGALGS